MDFIIFILFIIVILAIVGGVVWNPLALLLILLAIALFFGAGRGRL